MKCVAQVLAAAKENTDEANEQIIAQPFLRNRRMTGPPPVPALPGPPPPAGDMLHLDVCYLLQRNIPFIEADNVPGGAITFYGHRSSWRNNTFVACRYTDYLAGILGHFIFNNDHSAGPAFS